MLNFETINYSLRNLVKSKSRSMLTILSIFVGITTIFIFISFGWGLYDYVAELTTSSSADKLLVQARGNAMPGLDDTFKLEDSDVRAIKRSQGIVDATGVYLAPTLVEQKDKDKYTFLISYDPDVPMLMDISNIGIQEGRWLQPSDDRKAILGYNYLFDDKIFSKAYELNDKISVDGVDMKVVGFLEEVGNPQDDSQIYVTNGYFEELYPNDTYAMIVARIDMKKIDIATESVEYNLRKARDQDEGKEDFIVESFEEMIQNFMSSLNIIIGFVILIALISVLVSAVNTANTMITSVLERYKEIGILKSIGAKNSEIFSIFLFESSFLGFVAGVIGVLLGWGLTYMGGVWLDALGYGFLQPHYSTILFVGCILFATVTGAISGVAPAFNASRINTVDALRYE